MAPLRTTGAANALRPRRLLRRAAGRRPSRHRAARAGAAHAPASKDEQVPTAVEDPRQHLELSGLTEPSPLFGVVLGAGTVPVKGLGAVGRGPDVTDPCETSPAGVALGVQPRIEAIRFEVGSVNDDCDCQAVARNSGSEGSDEDRSTASPSDTEVSSDEDQRIADADACLVPDDVEGAEHEVDKEGHEPEDSRAVDCCEHRSNSVPPEDRGGLDKVDAFLALGKGLFGVRDASDYLDDGWEDRGAAAASKMVIRILSNAAPVAEVLPLPVFSGSRRRRVRFDMGAITVHEIPPYGEIYGAHPRSFVFDRHAQRVPAARNGYVSLQSVMGVDEDEDSSDDSSDAEAVADLQDSEAEDEEEDSWESYLAEIAEECSGGSPAENVCIPSCGFGQYLGA